MPRTPHDYLHVSMQTCLSFVVPHSKLRHLIYHNMTAIFPARTAGYQSDMHGRCMGESCVTSYAAAKPGAMVHGPLCSGYAIQPDVVHNKH